jgi:putative toxin-antitoxin system antitoxin component (TIGR02293 family)
MSKVLVFTEEVFDFLGGKRVLKRTFEPDEDITIIRKGLPPGSLTAVVEAGRYEIKELLRVVDISPRTWERRKREGVLSKVESDRVFRIAQVTARAVEALGDGERAQRWLKEPNFALGGEKPFSLLDTEAGEQRVLAVLGRIEHGVFS